MGIGAGGGGGLAVAAPPPGPGAAKLLRTRVPRTAGRRDARRRVTGAPGSAGAGTRGRAGGRGTHTQRGGPFLARLASLSPPSIGAAHGRGAGTRARDSRARGGPSRGDAGLDGSGGRRPPGRRLPRARTVRAGARRVICSGAGGSRRLQ